jgi:hypothetical protein
MSVPTFIGYLLLAFTAGLVLHPVFASVSRKISDRLWNRRVNAVVNSLRADGWTVLEPDHTVPTQATSTRPTVPDDWDSWGVVETGLGSTARGQV